MLFSFLVKGHSFQKNVDLSKFLEKYPWAYFWDDDDEFPDPSLISSLETDSPQNTPPSSKKKKKKNKNKNNNINVNTSQDFQDFQEQVPNQESRKIEKLGIMDQRLVTLNSLFDQSKLLNEDERLILAFDRLATMSDKEKNKDKELMETLKLLMLLRLCELYEKMEDLNKQEEKKLQNSTQEEEDETKGKGKGKGKGKEKEDENENESHEENNQSQENTIPEWLFLFFCRDNCENPENFAKNILRRIGDDLGIEQVELFLLAEALSVNINVYCLEKSQESDFMSIFDCKGADRSVQIVTTDGRHYNSILGSYSDLAKEEKN